MEVRRRTWCAVRVEANVNGGPGEWAVEGESKEIQWKGTECKLRHGVPRASSDHDAS